MGDGVDLRDERVVRSTYLHMLMDWEGKDLSRVYEPISQQLGMVFFTFLAIVGAYIAWKMLKKWREARKPLFTPYKVIRAPSSVVEEEKAGGHKKKRVCAILGGTGFIGSHVVDEFVRRKEYHVYMLGRKFRPERTNPAADALIQVDMQDFDGLVNAFQGVDSVIDVAAAIPTVFLSIDDIWRINKLGLENVVKAAQKAGVKNFIYICAVPVKGKIHDGYTRTFINSFYLGQKYVLEANGKEGMHTCVICPGNIVGLRSDFFDPLISGKMKWFPMLDNRFTFLPVEHLAKAIANAEQKLASGCEGIGGKSLPIVGEAMSFKQFLSLPTWPHKFSSVPIWLLKLMANLNVLCAKLSGRAPFGAELCPTIASFFSLEEEEVDCTTTNELLEMEPPLSMEEYVAELVKRYNAQP